MAELNRAKAEQLRRMPMQRDSIGGIAGQYLRLSDLGLPIDDEQTLAAHYLNITAADIEQAFATWLRPGDLAQVVARSVRKARALPWTRKGPVAL